MYITTSAEKRIRYSVTMRTIQYGFVNSAMGQISCSTERISCFNIILASVGQIDIQTNGIAISVSCCT